MYFMEVSSAKGSDVTQEQYKSGNSVLEAVRTGMSSQGLLYKQLRERHFQELAERLGVKQISITRGLGTSDGIDINFGDILLNSNPPPNAEPSYEFPEEHFEALYKALSERGHTIVVHPNQGEYANAKKTSNRTYIINVHKASPISGYESGPFFPKLTIFVNTGKKSAYSRPGFGEYTMEEVRTKQTEEGEEYVEFNSIGKERVLREGWFGGRFRRQAEPLYEVTILHDEEQHIKVGVVSSGGYISIRETDYKENPDVAYALDVIVEHLFNKNPTPMTLEGLS